MPATLTAETDKLSIAYETHGPEDGPPVLLLHGWPDDVRAWDGVAPVLAAAGKRVIVPHLRGWGPTRFLEKSTPRTGQPTALAQDAADLLDALHIKKVLLVGHDWGAGIGYVFAALWPERVERLVAMSSPYLPKVTPGSELDYGQQRLYWYQWFMGSERGREALQDNRREYCRFLWRTWSPTWKFTEGEFDVTAPSWDNPDFVDVVLHFYRVRWGNAPKDPHYAKLDARIAAHPEITVPTTLLHGGAEECSLPASTANQARLFPGGYHRQVLPGIGHFVPREQPDAAVRAILDN